MIRMACPSCHAACQFNERAAGRRARCQQCGQVFRVASVELEDDDLPVEGVATAAAADDDDFDILQFADGPEVAMPTPSVAEAATLTSSRSSAEQFAEEQEEAGRGTFAGFFRDVGRVLLFPLDLRSLVPCIFALILLVMSDVVSRIFWLFGLILLGWYVSYLFRCVQEGASGETILPEMGGGEGWYGDVIRPLMLISAAWIASMVPVFATAIYASILGRATIIDVFDAVFAILSYDADFSDPVALLMLVGLIVALFVQPLMFLMVAVGNVWMLFRLDWLVMTIAVTIVSYLFICIFWFLSSFGPAMLADALMPDEPGLGEVFATATVASIVEAYLALAAMQIIGLHYHHYKDKYAWSWG